MGQSGKMENLQFAQALDRSHGHEGRRPKG
jgi:hypothetical protein